MLLTHCIIIKYKLLCTDLAKGIAGSVPNDTGILSILLLSPFYQKPCLNRTFCPWDNLNKKCAGLFGVLCHLIIKDSVNVKNVLLFKIIIYNINVRMFKIFKILPMFRLNFNLIWAQTRSISSISTRCVKIGHFL